VPVPIVSMGAGCMAAISHFKVFLFNHHVKKGKLCLRIWWQWQWRWTRNLSWLVPGHSASMNMIVPCIIDDDVINGYHHLRRGNHPSSESSMVDMLYVSEYFCELLGGINSSACLFWGFAASVEGSLILKTVAISAYFDGLSEYLQWQCMWKVKTILDQLLQLLV